MALSYKIHDLDLNEAQQKLRDGIFNMNSWGGETGVVKVYFPVHCRDFRKRISVWHFAIPSYYWIWNRNGWRLLEDKRTDFLKGGAHGTDNKREILIWFTNNLVFTKVVWAKMM